MFLIDCRLWCLRSNKWGHIYTKNIFIFGKCPKVYFTQKKAIIVVACIFNIKYSKKGKNFYVFSQYTHYIGNRCINLENVIEFPVQRIYKIYSWKWHWLILWNFFFFFFVYSKPRSKNKSLNFIWLIFQFGFWQITYKWKECVLVKLLSVTDICTTYYVQVLCQIM